MPLPYMFQMLTLVLGCFLACQPAEGSRETNEEETVMNTTPLQEEYQALIQQLEEESMALTPMLMSVHYPNVILKGEAIVPHLVTSIKDTTVRHYLSLMALAALNADALQQVPVITRLTIYKDAMEKGGIHNDYGLVGEYFDGIAKDMINIGEEAIPYITPLLEDTTSLKVWGSKTVMINDRLQNRTCDFAYCLILAILQQQVPYPETPAGRDEQIVKLKQTLQQKGY